MSPAAKVLLLRSALFQAPAIASRTATHSLSTLALARAMLLRAPPVASVVVGTATAIVTEKIASKLVDKVADEAATKAVETAKTAVAAVTGLDLELDNKDGENGSEPSSNRNSPNANASTSPSAPSSAAPMGQRRTITTRTSVKVTPQKSQQPYDYKPISDIDSIADQIGPESTREAIEDMRSAAAESSTKSATDHHLHAAQTRPRGTEETQQLKETVRGFAGSLVQDQQDMWQDAKHEWNETLDVGKDMIKDTAQSIKGTVGKVLGAGMGDATKVVENAQSMFASGADVVGNAATQGKETAKEKASSAAEAVDDAYSTVNEKVKDSYSTAAGKVMDSVASAKDKAKDTYASARKKASDSADRVSEMYSHAADRAEDAVSASRAADLAHDTMGTVDGMADAARAMGHEAVDRTKAKANEVKDSVLDATHNMTGQAKVAVDRAQDTVHEAKAGAKEAAAGYAASMAGKSAIERAKEAAQGGSSGALAGLDDLPVGHSMNDYLDEAEDQLRGGNVQRRSKL